MREQDVCGFLGLEHLIEIFLKSKAAVQNCYSTEMILSYNL